MVKVLANRAGRAPQLALVRAHPELAGKAMVTKSLTAESTNEQTKAGLTHCTPEEFAHIQQLNARLQRQVWFPVHLGCARPAWLWFEQVSKSSAPLSAACTTTPITSWLSVCATSTASWRFASTTNWATNLTLGSRGVGLARMAGPVQRCRCTVNANTHHTPHAKSSPSPT